MQISGGGAARPARSQNVKTQEKASEFFGCFDLFLRRGRGSSTSVEKEGGAPRRELAGCEHGCHRGDGGKRC